MSSVTVYCVETFWRNKGHMEKGQLRQFGCPDQALSAGRALSSRMPGVLVYRVSGSPKVDYWEEPVVLAAHGDTPGLGV